MNATLVIAFCAVFAVFLAVGCFFLLREIRRSERRSARIATVQARAQGRVETSRPATPSPLHIIGVFGLRIVQSGMLSSSTLRSLEHTLASAGLRSGNGLGLFVGSKILLLFVLPSTAIIGIHHFDVRPFITYAAIAGSAIVGLLLPDYIVRSLRQRHLARVEVGLADALDLLVICTESGLALEPAISRVGMEVRHAHPAVSEELMLTAHELRITADGAVAIGNLGLRTGLDSLRRLSTTLIQTLHYGTPLAQALRVLSAEMRQDMLTRFEARAARLPVLLTCPMIIFLLPCVFLIVGGPAMIQVMRAFKH